MLANKDQILIDSLLLYIGAQSLKLKTMGFEICFSFSLDLVSGLVMKNGEVLAELKPIYSKQINGAARIQNYAITLKNLVYQVEAVA